MPRPPRADGCWPWRARRSAPVWVTMMGHSPGIASQPLEEGQQILIRPITPGLAVVRRGFGEDLLFESQVCIEIDLGGFDRLMSEPECNDRAIHTGLQEFHGCGVSKHVRRDTFLSQHETRLSCLGHVPCDHVLNANSAQTSAAPAGEQNLGISSALFPQPRLEYRNCGLRQRSTAFLAPFAMATDVRTSAERDVFVPQSRHL